MRLGRYLSELTRPELDDLYEMCGFTKEETNICEMIRHRKTYIEIANKLGYSTKTIYRRVCVIKPKIEKCKKGGVNNYE